MTGTIHSPTLPASPHQTAAHRTHDVGAAGALAPMVEVWFRLRTEHVPDPDNCCRACTSAGTGVRSTPWPCSIRVVADEARRRHAGRWSAPATSSGMAAAAAVPSPRPASDPPARPSARRRLHGERGTSCQLTPREREFLQLAADGCADSEIAVRLDVPERTVATSIRRITRKLGVPSRDSLLVLALRAGVVV